MTHYTVLVRFEGDIREAEKRIEEMLHPYWEEKEEIPKKYYLKEEEICTVCGFNISKARKEGRQWAMSHQFSNGKWICGYCRDEVQSWE